MLIVRTGTLFSIALFSTSFTVIILVWYSGMDIRMLDVMTNTICILLMQGSMVKYFDILCGERGICCCKYTSKKMYNILMQRSMSRAPSSMGKVHVATNSPISTPRAND